MDRFFYRARDTGSNPHWGRFGSGTETKSTLASFPGTPGGLQCSNSTFLHQVCVESCPSANEFGVRDNPVCVDSVMTADFVNLTSGNPLDVTMRVTVRCTTFTSK